MNCQERRAAGRKSQARESASPAALYEAGLRHLRAEQYLDAQICCQQALATDSNHADSLNLMGMLSLQAKQYDHAVEWVARALRQDPKPEYLVTLGSALQNQGRLEEALKAFDKAVQLKPDVAELWKNLGNVLVALERPAEALLSFQHILTLNPRHWEAANKSALLLHQLGRLEEAVKHFDLCDQLRPDHVLTLRARTRSLRDLNRLEEALQDIQRARALDPGDADACNSLGDILARWPDRQEEALQWFDRALELQPDLIQALTNKAVVFGQRHRFEEAIAIYHRLQSLDPDNAEVEMGLGHLHLLLGNFESGWAGHEARRKIRSFSAPYPEFSQPLWLGEEAIDGKTILVHVDEGFGDTIQFARYVSMLAARGAHVILVVDGPAYAQPASHNVLRSQPIRCRRLTSIVRCPACHWPFEPVSIRFRQGYRTCLHPRKAACRPGKAALVHMTGCGWGWSGPAIQNTGTTTIDQSRCGRFPASLTSTRPS
jgi:tetratricopeptide (TPR) repeat protein